MSDKPKRPYMPLAVKLAACLHLLGIDPDNVEFDHDPSLGMRPRDPETGDWIPPANDPRHIVPRSADGHKLKTFGDHVPLSGDVSKIAKLDRIEKEQAAFRARLLAKETGEPVVKRKAWPKRPFPKRPRS